MPVEGYETTLPGIDYENFILHTNDDGLPEVKIDENQLLTINYTSGTTSKPKGVMLTHRGNYMNAANFIYHLRSEA
ncbi:AMP-binding protein [Peribacillus frigoritolerans]|nr:AMP-binding protein [Peribacillus frigoritolerans]